MLSNDCGSDGLYPRQRYRRAPWNRWKSLVWPHLVRVLWVPRCFRSRRRPAATQGASKTRRCLTSVDSRTSRSATMWRSEASLSRVWTAGRRDRQRCGGVRRLFVATTTSSVRERHGDKLRQSLHPSFASSWRC